MKAEDIIGAVQAVTGKWTRQRKREEREANARHRRDDAMSCRRGPSIREIAFSVMRDAYMKASANDTLPAHARQIMYAARPMIQQYTHRALDDAYFTQNLLPSYIEEHGLEEKWHVVYDARGHFTEPHTDRQIALGTLQVRQHLGEIEDHEVQAPDYHFIEKHYPTLGPEHRYGAILFIEKEGFMPLFRTVQLAARYDIAIMSTKGMSVTASRELVDKLCGSHGIRLFVLHDFDVSGFSIFGTLKGDTWRYRFQNKVETIDLGLRLADVGGLETERVTIKSQGKTQATLLRHGATADECKFLMSRRVELNALPSDQLVAFIERKLKKHGVRKVVPDDDTLAAAYGRMQRQATIQARIAELVEEMDEEPEDAIAVPAAKKLRQQITAAQKKDPALPWDVALRQIVARECGAD